MTYSSLRAQSEFYTFWNLSEQLAERWACKKHAHKVPWVCSEAAIDLQGLSPPGASPSLAGSAALLFTLRPHGGAMGIPRAEDERPEPVLALCQHGAGGGFEEGQGTPSGLARSPRISGEAPLWTGDGQQWRNRRRLG